MDINSLSEDDKEAFNTIKRMFPDLSNEDVMDYLRIAKKLAEIGNMEE